MRERLREQAETHVTALADDAGDRGLVAEPVVCEGLPAEEVVEYASDHDVDVVAIGTHGRGGFRRAVLLALPTTPSERYRDPC